VKSTVDVWGCNICGDVVVTTDEKEMEKWRRDREDVVHYCDACWSRHKHGIETAVEKLLKVDGSLPNEKVREEIEQLLGFILNESLAKVREKMTHGTSSAVSSSSGKAGFAPSSGSSSPPAHSHTPSAAYGAYGHNDD
jgi:hypothetical protein